MTKNILVVDDESGNIEILTRFLEMHDYSCRTAENGKEALDVIRQQVPDLMMLDLKMPVMDGVETLRTIRKQGHEFPILILTASYNEELKAQTLDLGAQDYITKPLFFKSLINKVDSWLNKPLASNPTT